VLISLLLLNQVNTTPKGGVSQYPAYPQHPYLSGPTPSTSHLPRPRPTRNTAANIPRDLVTEIHCLQMDSHASFSAVLRLPPSHTAPPVLEDGEQGSCQISATSLPDVFLVDLSLLTECGVRECEEKGETWLCLLVRYPVLRGLRLPEDEVINIKCKPQDRAVTGENAINFQEAMVEQRSPAIFSGGGHQFISEIGLFRQLAGTHLFAARVKSGSQIELGENVQLRSIVRSGDGWNYSKLTDVVIQRIRDGQPLQTPESAVKLVYSDGCRDQAYRTLAPAQPWREDLNPLVNNFDFRVFMFQEMQSGDSIIITAKVVACVEEEDCRIQCVEEIEGNNIRKRREVELRGKTEGWEENMELRVTLPDDRKVSASPDASECRLFLIVTLATALTFCVLSACIVLFACFRRWQEGQAKTKVVDTASIRSNSSAGFKTVSPIKGTSDTGSQGIQAALYFVPYCGGQMVTPTSKPVTVRSVKRRDRSKSLDRERRERKESLSENSEGEHVREERAVMV